MLCSERTKRVCTGEARSRRERRALPLLRCAFHSRSPECQCAPLDGGRRRRAAPRAEGGRLRLLHLPGRGLHVLRSACRVRGQMESHPRIRWLGGGAHAADETTQFAGSPVRRRLIQTAVCAEREISARLSVQHRRGRPVLTLRCLQHRLSLTQQGRKQDKATQIKSDALRCAPQKAKGDAVGWEHGHRARGHLGGP